MTELPDGPWSVAQGTYDEHPLIVRINAGAAAVRGDITLRHRVGVAVPLNAPDPAGLPAAAEAVVLTEIEDALIEALGVGRSAVHALVVTTSGIREFVFHTRTPEAVDTAVAGVRDRFPSHDVQWILGEDPDWDVYAQFTE